MRDTRTFFTSTLVDCLMISAPLLIRDYATRKCIYGRNGLAKEPRRVGIVARRRLPPKKETKFLLVGSRVESQNKAVPTTHQVLFKTGKWSYQWSRE